jgi:glutamine synthetase
MTAVEQTMDRLRGQGIHSILAQFCDLHGVARGKLVPVGLLRDWVEVGAGFSGPSIWGTGLPRHGPRSEYFGRVQLESLRALPFMPGVAHAVCDGHAGGEPLETCSRQLLRRQLARIAERGWTLWVGIEPEFFLLRQDATGRWVPADSTDDRSKPSYDIQALQRNQDFLEDMRKALVNLGFDLQQIDHEDANGQYEINYRFDSALQAADRYLLFKVTAHALAERHGMVFSCMPKPLAHAPGSGLHFHLSLTDADGKALFTDDTDPQGIGWLGRAFIAGLLHHADALSALCAPTVNSYRRLAVSHSASGTTWSPVWKAWGDNNRTCLVRTVAGRIEWRLPDPSCNVYAAIAATLAAGLAGIDAGLSPAPACALDLYEQCAAGAEDMPERLPRDLCAALEALRKDASLRRALGDAFCQEFLAIKSAEWDAFHRHVSEWEFQQYARAY